jgi:hypothetical protein
MRTPLDAGARGQLPDHRAVVEFGRQLGEGVARAELDVVDGIDRGGVGVAGEVGIGIELVGIGDDPVGCRFGACGVIIQDGDPALCEPSGVPLRGRQAVDVDSEPATWAGLEGRRRAVLVLVKQPSAASPVGARQRRAAHHVVTRLPAHDSERAPECMEIVHLDLADPEPLGVIAGDDLP